MNNHSILVHFPFFFLLFPFPLLVLLPPAAAPESELAAKEAAAAAAAPYIPGGSGWFLRCLGTSSAILMSRIRPAIDG